MKTLIAPTESQVKLDKSQVAVQTAAGTDVVVTLLNSHGYSVNDFVVIGEEGSQQAEMAKVTAVTPTTITVDTLNLTHFADEPVTQFRFNKRKFYGSTTLNGTYTELVGYGSPVAISVNDPQGTMLEYVGGEGYLFFKSTYYNSVTFEESDLLESTATPGDESARYCSLYAIRSRCGLTNNPYFTDGQVDAYRTRAEAEVDSYVLGKYPLPFTNSSNVPEVPALIEQITSLLAAGYIDYVETGKDGEGVRWLGEARGMLNKISTGAITLLGSDKQPMTRDSTVQTVQGYPNSVDDTSGPIQAFKMTDRW